MQQEQYDVFISYSRKDYVDAHDNPLPDSVVAKVKERLQREGLTYWFDEEGIYSGERFAALLTKNIKASKILLFISSQNANASEWTAKEIGVAHAFKKHIIPFRIDDSRYNEEVLIHLVNLDHIIYFENPGRALDRLVKSIHAHLDKMRAEEEKRLEDERKRQEEERLRREAEEQAKREAERRHREQQARIIDDIRLSCTKLNNEETKLNLDRSNLMLQVERVEDENTKQELQHLIAESSPMRKKYATDTGEWEEKAKVLENSLHNVTKERERLALQLEKISLQNAKLQDSHAKLQSDHTMLQDVLVDCRAKLEKSSKEGSRLQELQRKNTELQRSLSLYRQKLTKSSEEISRLRAQQKIQDVPEPNDRKWHFIYLSIILALAILSGILLLRGHNNTNESAEANVPVDTISKNSTATGAKPQVREVKDMPYTDLNVGTYSYTGKVDSEKTPDGQGKAIFNNGDTFEGTFAHGAFRKGRYTWADTKTYFVGEFENGSPVDGKGAYYDARGNKQ